MGMSERTATDGLIPSPAAEEAQRRFRLVLADDHPEVRAGIRQLLGLEFDVLAAVADGAALVEAVAELKPDAVISDIQMPHVGGLEASAQILQSGLCAAIVVLSVHPDLCLVTRALQSGILAYVLKVDATEELIPAVRAALRGVPYLSRTICDEHRGLAAFDSRSASRG